MKNAKNKQKTRISFSLLIVASLLFLTISSSIHVNAAYPKQRISHKMIYDSVNDRIIMYGGLTSSGESYRVFDTWSYDYNTNEWTKMITDNTPYASNARIAYDSESEKIISFGGSHADNVVSNQTWIYDYTESTWTQATPTNVPTMRTSSKMVYDSESDVVIMFGGSLDKDSNPDGVKLAFNDTWSYDYNTNTWTNITSATYPSNYWFDCVAYDTESDLVIVFGGTTEDNAYLDPTGEAYHEETWSFDYNTNTWDNITPSINPVPRTGASMVYDSEHDLIILFGGYTHLLRTEIDHETWSFDYNTLSWTELNPESNLERRAYSMAYDSESEKVVLFGGNIGDDPYTFFGDTWVFDYDFNNWTLMPIPEVPDDSNAFLIPTILSISIIAIVVMKRRKNN